MEAVRDVLREAESWSTLESEVVALLAESAYDRAAERLADARKSMLVFQNTPEHESRRLLMVSLQNQLEASLSAALVAAINATDVAACKRYYSIFAHIQREAEFRNYYNGARREPLVTMWKEAAVTDDHFTEFWPKFLHEFLALISTERVSCAAIFPDPQASLSALIQSTFDALSPSLSQRLGSVAENGGTRALQELIAIYKAAEDFALATERVMEKLHFASTVSPPTTSLSTPGDNDTGLKRRHSKRHSISMRLSTSSRPAPLHPAASSWAPAVFEPFLSLQADYAQLEARFLDATLRGSDAEPDEARRIRERLLDVFNAAEDALGRCLAFTHGLGSPGLLHALESQLKACLDGAVPAAASATSSSTAPVDLALQIGYNDNDLQTFQLALHLLETCQSAEGRLDALEGRLRSSLVQVAHALRGKESTSMQLLHASSLNSLELHNLLDSVTVDMTVPPTTAGLAPPPHTPGIPTSPSFGKKTLPAVRAKLLSGVYAALSSFTREVQAFLQRTILAPLLALVSTYPMQPVWAQAAQTASSGLAVPTFGLSPSRAMQRLADGLLSLPQLFEMYEADNALGYSLHTLPHSVVDPDAEEDDATGAWLASLMRAVLAQLTGAALPGIRALTVPGAKQLVYDLEYLGTVVRTFGVESEELDRWKETLDMDETTLKTAEDGGGDIGRWTRRVRGWS